jgi:hypothetical protein
MERNGQCERCRRPLEGLYETDDLVVCAGCMTAAEDVQETEAVVALLERRYADLEESDPAAARPLRAAMARVLRNLDDRHVGSGGAIVQLFTAPAGPSVSAEQWAQRLNGGLTKQ